MELVAAGDIEIPWVAVDDDALVRAVLLGESEAVVAQQTPVAFQAARDFRTRSGGYRLNNAFRYAIGRPTGSPARGA